MDRINRNEWTESSGIGGQGSPEYAQDGVKDVTDYITLNGVDKFKALLTESKTLTEIRSETAAYLAVIRRTLFPPISVKEVVDILGLTIKEDATNKMITFLCMLSAYTDSSQYNISFNAPSSTGKSYIPLELATLFPDEDTRIIGYCSPTAFFHDYGVCNKETKEISVDLHRKILIFLDQPHTLLLQHLRPLLSHDKKEISIKITDKSKNIGLRTKNILIKGYPSVVFCTAGLKIDEQESTRFLLLSPDVTQEKIRAAILEKLLKESNNRSYYAALNNNPDRQVLKERVKAIKDEHIENITIGSPDKIREAFFLNKKILKPRHARDIGRVISLIKVFALLNLWHREREGLTIEANDEDITQALKLWTTINESQELNLPPYIYDIHMNIIAPLLDKATAGLKKQDIIREHFKAYGRPLLDWQLRREILPMLEMAGLIIQDTDPDDKRRTVIYSVKAKPSEQSSTDFEVEAGEIIEQ